MPCFKEYLYRTSDGMLSSVWMENDWSWLCTHYIILISMGKSFTFQNIFIFSYRKLGHYS